MQQCPRSPRLGTTTDCLERKRSIVLSPHRTPTWARSNHLEQYHRSLHLVFEVICESRGLINLTPSRSRLFKLIGRVKGMRWSCSKRLAYMVAKHMQMRARREGKARSWNYDQEVILEQPISSITLTPCSLPGPRREETITATHTVDVF